MPNIRLLSTEEIDALEKNDESDSKENAISENSQHESLLEKLSKPFWKPQEGFEYVVIIAIIVSEPFQMLLFSNLEFIVTILLVLIGVILFHGIVLFHLIRKTRNSMQSCHDVMRINWLECLRHFMVFLLLMISLSFFLKPFWVQDALSYLTPSEHLSATNSHIINLKVIFLGLTRLAGIYLYTIFFVATVYSLISKLDQGFQETEKRKDGKVYILVLTLYTFFVGIMTLFSLSASALVDETRFAFFNDGHSHIGFIGGVTHGVMYPYFSIRGGLLLLNENNWHIIGVLVGMVLSISILMVFLEAMKSLSKGTWFGVTCVCTYISYFFWLAVAFANMLTRL